MFYTLKRAGGGGEFQGSHKDTGKGWMGAPFGERLPPSLQAPGKAGQGDGAASEKGHASENLEDDLEASGALSPATKPKPCGD